MSDYLLVELPVYKMKMTNMKKIKTHLKPVTMLVVIVTISKIMGDNY